VSAPEGQEAERGLGDTLRTAVESALAAAERSAKAGTDALGSGRGAELVDEMVRRGREARDELARRGQEAGAELSRRGQEAGAAIERRGQEARGEIAKRLELLERRLTSVEELLRNESKSKPEG
jgi:polyhydroxyalkanoate synthesis regulator phasin